MSKAVTFRLDDDTLQSIDQIAASMDRDRSYVINEAVHNYLEVKQWHAEQIRLAIAGADAGEFATEQEVKAAFDAFKAKA
jgi:predicted transcriptional regulator